MDKIFSLKLTEAHLNIIYQALLELPAKVSVPVMEVIKRQYDEQSVELKEEDKPE
jgi:hypothetical protein